MEERQTEVLDSIDSAINSLDSAIKKREFTINWNFSELKILYYYQAQQKFKTAIDSIDSKQYDEVKHRLSNVSDWSLDQIADSINAF
ncbi:MAG: hypothetical protein IPK90_08190 [Chitinophagaceae bacterium]|nr:hypothetical protein [Chitinophagaceae bacterium]